jgi:virulence-associated protein VagC
MRVEADVPMAAIVKSASKARTAVICHQGWPTVSRSFRTNRVSNQLGRGGWACCTEDETLRGVSLCRSRSEATTVIAAALQHYLEEATPLKCSVAVDGVVIKRMGNTVVLLPKHDPWQLIFDTLSELPDDFTLTLDQQCPAIYADRWSPRGAMGLTNAACWRGRDDGLEARGH